MYLIEIATAAIVVAFVSACRWLGGPRDQGFASRVLGTSPGEWGLRRSLAGLAGGYLALALLAGGVAYSQGVPTGRSVFRVRHITAGSGSVGKLRKGDLIVATNGTHVGAKKALGDFIQKNGQRPIKFKTRRNGEELTIALTPARDPFDGRLRVGFSFDPVPEIEPPGWGGIVLAVAVGPIRAMASEVFATVGSMWRTQSLSFPLQDSTPNLSVAKRIHLGFRFGIWLWIALLLADVALFLRYLLAHPPH